MSGIELATTGDVATQVQKLREVCAWVMDASADDAFAVATKAKQARAYIKAIEGSAAIAREATRLECIAYRRLGQLGSTELLPKGEPRNIAKAFAAMADDEFADWLEQVGPHSGAIGTYRMVNRAAAHRRMREDGESVGSGKAVRPLEPSSMHDLVEAASAMLNALTAEDVPFTVTEIADGLAESLGVVPHYTAPAREGYREAVRLAMALPPGEDDNGPHDDAPRWVTYEEDAMGWVRVPFRVASLEQFAAMVKLRRAQADQMEAVAARFEWLLSEMADVEAEMPGEPCGRLARMVRGTYDGSVHGAADRLEVAS